MFIYGFVFFICFCTVSEWLLFNANSSIFQLYNGENKLIFIEMNDEVRFGHEQDSQNWLKEENISFNNNYMI
jgi:hypothetical protein